MNKIVKFCLVSLAVLACMTACTKYDDTEIRESIKDLQDRVKALESQVADNVSAIQSMITLGSVQSVTIDAQTGKAVIKLKDGSSVTVDCETVGYSLITVEKDSDGEYYWAICEDGEVAPLLIDGKKVPVSVTPALKLSEQNEWMISADGGKTWVPTGIFQNQGESGDNTQQPGETVSFFQNVEYDGDYLYLTLMDGKEIKVVVAGEGSFVAAADALYFTKESIEKSVTIEMNNVKAFTITEKPEGWKARVEFIDEVYSLVVTSPEDISFAVKSGTVKILGLFNDGRDPEIISVEIVYEEPFVLSAGVGASAKMTVSEHALEDFQGYVLGVWNVNDFTPETVVAWLNTEEGYLSECRTESRIYEMTELVDGYDFSQPYIVYAAAHVPVKQIIAGSAAYTVEDLQFIEVGSEKVAGLFHDIRYDSAMLTLNSYLDVCYGGFSDLNFWEAIGRDNMLESLEVGNMSPLEVSVYEGYANFFPGGVEGPQILPSTDYVVWLMPESESGTYSAEDFIYFTFTSAPITSDSSIPAPTSAITEITYGGFTAVVTPPSGVYKTYAAIRKLSVLPEDMQQSVTELIDIDNYSLGTSPLTVSSNTFSNGEEACLVAVSLMEDGRYGQVLQQTVELKPLEYSDNIGVAASSEVHGLGDVTLTLSFSGTPSTVTYYCTSTNYFSDDMLQEMLVKGQIGEAVNDLELSKLKDGNTIEFTGLSLGLEHTFYVLVKDAQGVPSKMTKVNFTPIVLIDYIFDTSSDYSYGMPVVSGTKSGTKYTYTVTRPETCVKYWMFIGDFEYLSGSSTSAAIVDEYVATDKLVTMQLENLGEMELTESYSGTFSPVRNTTRIYMAWLDDKGSYHAIYTINPNK